MEKPPTVSDRYLVWVRGLDTGWDDQPGVEFYDATKKEWTSRAGILIDGGIISRWAYVTPPIDVPFDEEKIQERNGT